MTRRQSRQRLASATSEGLQVGDAVAAIDQELVSAQNSVVAERAGYNKSLGHRAEVINLAHAAGWSKYRIAKRLGLTRRAVDEALERPMPRTPGESAVAESEPAGEDRSERLAVLGRNGQLPGLHGSL